MFRLHRTARSASAKAATLPQTSPLLAAGHFHGAMTTGQGYGKHFLFSRRFRALPHGADKRALFEQKGLYRQDAERDNCGVGMIAHLKKTPSRRIVVDANDMLVRMSHRGGCGCDPASGDGAGMLVALPHTFMQRIVKDGEFGAAAAHLTLEAEKYAVGNVFFNKSVPASIPNCKRTFQQIADSMGIKVVGWRRVPTTNNTLGATSKASEPHVEQVMVLNENPSLSSDNFEKELLRLRTVVTAINEKKHAEFYVCSLSNRTITYKGQLTPEQLFEYYDDLTKDDFASYVALVHSRFSTNTFPSWDRAQPNRIMCHNGEINTLRGNKNWMFARGGTLHSSYFGHKTADLLPVCSDLKSDSGNFDAVLEILTKASSCNRSLPEGMMMMIPEAWQNDPLIDAHKKDMYKYQSMLIEPWDGPAMMAFTDGKYIGATLDRNGLRPSRYYVTKDDHVVLSSEIGVLDHLEEKDIKIKKRLEPGKMFLVDFERGVIVPDEEVKRTVSQSRPFKQWLDENLVSLSELTLESSKAIENKPKRRKNYTDVNRRLNMFGFTTETMDLLMMPMGITGKEALGSMGNDAPLAVLSEQPKLPFEYFKQLFAQVTNPPIDPIREELVMSLVCPVGPEGNILDATAAHAKRLLVEHPVLSTREMEALKVNRNPDWTPVVLDATFPANSGPRGLVDALYRLCEEATDAISHGKTPILVLSDKMAGVNRYPVPSLLAVGAVHQHLLRTQQRTSAALFTECGDAKEVHDFCTLLGFGADGISPYMAEEALQKKMNDEGLLKAHAGRELSNDEVFDKYKSAVGKGILKVMSKMGISTLQSYKGAQVFEAVGLGEDIIEMCFAGTTSRIQGTDFEALYTDISRFHEAGYPSHSDLPPLLRNPGSYHFRNASEVHYNSPKNIVALQRAARENSREAYRQYVEETDALCRRVNLRGLLDFKFAKEEDMPPLEEVESVASIVKRFNTGAMSLGSISQETHEALAIAMNTIGGRSNTGEGGEDTKRFTTPGGPANLKRSAIKQVASGRFGVTMNYLTNADQLQIKMAQGAKPGEGGELPGHKVSDYIGSMRHTTPGVGLISPPPHHDIYSIEDLAQLIHDLKHSNPSAEVSVKLVSEVGVGVVAAGVAKAKSDHITISGHDGGTGASSWTGVKNGGLPWELGLAEAQQTLVLNDLRSRVKLQTDGQLKTGRDVTIAALLGAEEFGFATGPLIALGCIMMRKCHLNTCPVGVATQDPELRKKFTGQPEHVINFMFMMAEEVREYIRKLGFRSIDELVGRADLLQVNKDALHYKSAKLDLSPLLVNAQTLNEKAGVRKLQEQAHTTHEALDMTFIEKAKQALEHKKPIVIENKISNLNRTLGATLSHEVCKRYGAEGLPDGTIHLKLSGHGGQSLAFGLAKGIFMELEGDSNDYVGKALSGGEVVVYPSSDFTEPADENVIVGNAVLYGATSGEAYFSGKAGERFCVRNSGVKAVVEGVGDHGCEYMTGGRVVVLGSTGRNFAAGMSGGIAYIYDEDGSFDEKCNMGMVGVATLAEAAPKEEIAEVKALIAKHVERTGSAKGQRVLANWDASTSKIKRVMPYDYERVLLQRALQSSDAVLDGQKKTASVSA